MSDGAAADPAARWGWLREQTPATRDRIYVNCGYQGPMSRPVVEAMRAWLDYELELGPMTRAVFEARNRMAARYRELVASMIGADVDEVAITEHTSRGINLVTAGVGIEPGDGVVTSGVEHAAGIIPTYFLRERRGAELRIVPLAADDSAGAIAESFAGAFDARTRLVLASGISYSSGQRLPIEEIIALAHRANPGARVLIDGAQVIGQEPIDVHANGADAYVFPMHKWLCGPSGLGALYVRRDRIAEIEPAAVSGPAAAAWDFAGEFTPQRDSILKFEMTTLSGALLAGGIAAIEQYAQSGPAAVWDRVRALNRYAERRFERVGVSILSARAEANRSGLFTVRAPGIAGPALAYHLQETAGVVCRFVRELDAARFALHVYNTEDEIERIAEAVERTLVEGVSAEALAQRP